MFTGNVPTLALALLNFVGMPKIHSAIVSSEVRPAGHRQIADQFRRPAQGSKFHHPEPVAVSMCGVVFGPGATLRSLAIHGLGQGGPMLNRGNLNFKVHAGAS